MNRSILYYPINAIEVNKKQDSLLSAILETIIEKATEIMCKDYLVPCHTEPTNDFIDADEYELAIYINAYKYQMEGYNV